LLLSAHRLVLVVVYMVGLLVVDMTTLLYSSTPLFMRKSTGATRVAVAVHAAATFQLTTTTTSRRSRSRKYQHCGDPHHPFREAPLLLYHHRNNMFRVSPSSPSFLQHSQFISSLGGGGGGGSNNDERDTGTTSTTTSSATSNNIAPPMAYVHQEWTLEQDELLWENQDRLDVEQLASLLGRGLGGVDARLTKLKNVNNAAYQRLFADKKRRRSAIDDDDDDDDDDDNDNDSNTKKSQKLVPVSEVLRRIQWDYQLDPTDFSVLHYDRVEDRIVETAMDAPNTQISGNAARFIDALPEHRIVGIKYRERIVWDRPRKLDLFFSSSKDHGGIETVIATYDAWKAEKDAAEAATRARQAEVSDMIRRILGLDRFAQFQEISSSLVVPITTDEEPATMSMKKRAAVYVETALDLFRQVRRDPSPSLEPMLIPMNDYQALDTISELAAICLPDTADVRSIVLAEINVAMQRILGKSPQQKHQPDDVELQQQRETPVFDKASSKRRPLPEFREEDVTEKFVKGSGAGGQKVNKTSNRVVLVHIPTNIRIECQDTRSLQQNRKIARKRLREKLDEYLNGSQSKASLAAAEASIKKKKALARSRARQRKRKEESSSVSAPTESSTDGSDDDDDDDFVVR
jgi:peptide chain release factor